MEQVRVVAAPDTRIAPVEAQYLLNPAEADRTRDMLRAIAGKIESLEHAMNMDRMFMEALARRDSLITELAEWRAKAEVAELAERRAKEEVAELAERRAKEIVAAEMAKRRADLCGRARSFAQGSLLLTLLFRRFLGGKPNAEELAGRVLQGKSRWSLPPE